MIGRTVIQVAFGLSSRRLSGVSDDQPKWVLMTDEIHKSVFHSLHRAFIHSSTFSENALAMRAGLATMRVLQQEGLAARAEFLGNEFREELRAALTPYEMVKEVRGEGMLTGIEFRAPDNLPMRMAFEAFK